MFDIWPYIVRVIKWTEIKQACARDKEKCVKLVVKKQRLRVCRKAVRSCNDNIKRDLKINKVTLMTVVS